MRFLTSLGQSEELGLSDNLWARLLGMDRVKIPDGADVSVNWHHLGDNRHARDAFKDHPWYDDCAYFCEHYDQASFDRDYDTLPLEHFEPMVRRIFARQPFGAHLDEAAA